eukprot:NODE_1256_length_1191_cov_480.071303.p1 GENE.NODE_1256_length_1191_cov_480.071303~~NODE_1256_length_1191_cov_480.071303.p1  ORF type:complete len:367 (+),score=46.66 NODE_1256_length_1191_cov_480.071303:3-1103(+)
MGDLSECTGGRPKTRPMTTTGNPAERSEAFAMAPGCEVATTAGLPVAEQLPACDHTILTTCNPTVGSATDCEAPLASGTIATTDGLVALPALDPGRGASHWLFMAAHAELIVSADTVLRTRFVTWMKRWPRAFDVFTLITLVSAEATWWLAGMSLIRVTYVVPSSGEEHTIITWEPNTWPAIAVAVLLLLFFFLVAHDLNRELSWRALRSFDSIMFGGSVMVSIAAGEMNGALALDAAGLYTPHMAITRIVATAPLTVMPMLFFCCIDGFRVRPHATSKFKLILLGYWLVQFCTGYITARFFEDDLWSKLEVCYWIAGCTQLRAVYLVGAANAATYAAKIFRRCAQGYGLALVSASYAAPEPAASA